jgi:hypothetical protein
MASTEITSSKETKVLWFCLSDGNPVEENESNWKRYSDFENKLIEEKYQKKERAVELNDYVIDFEHSVQSEKDDPSKERPVKREEVDVTQYMREERFCYSEKPVKLLCTSKQWGSEFIQEWNTRKRNEAMQQPRCYTKIFGLESGNADKYVVEEAIEGTFY